MATALPQSTLRSSDNSHSSRILIGGLVAGGIAVGESLRRADTTSASAAARRASNSVPRKTGCGFPRGRKMDRPIRPPSRGPDWS